MTATKSRLDKLEKAAHIAPARPIYAVRYDGQPGYTLTFGDGRKEHVDQLPAGPKIKGYVNFSPDDWDTSPNPQGEPIEAALL